VVRVGIDSAAMQSSPVAGGTFRPLAILKRRATAVIIAFVIALVIAVATAFLLPARYVAKGTILIEQQEVPSDLVRSTISSYADQRIQVITQRVMTTENLMRIIRKYDLYADDRNSRGREVVIERMRDDVTFQTISADVIDPRMGRPVQATIAFSLSYRSRSSETAARVANELSSLYLEENLASRRQLTEQAATFLTDESEKLAVRIRELETTVAGFKEQHVNTLPEFSQLNIQLVSRADDEKRDVDTELRALDQQIVFLDAQLAQLSSTSQIYTSTGERVMSPTDRLKVLRSEYSRKSSIYAADHPDVLRLKREIEGLEAGGQQAASERDQARTLLDARAELESLRQRYAADHPDVVRQERLVAGLEREATSKAVTPSESASEEADNPAYIQIRAQREAADNQRTSLLRKRADILAKIGDLEQRLASTPGVEREYMSLIRDLENAQIKYREVRQKQMEAQLAQNLETERKGERFTLIEPPIAPEEPTTPNRRLILALGTLLAALGALGIALLLEALDRSVRDQRDLAALLAVPPLAVIPWIDTVGERNSRMRRRRLALVGAAASLIAVIALTHTLYKPLDVMWAVAMRRLGV
jgi:polysaccharide biosynthesis transport protein